MKLKLLMVGMLALSATACAQLVDAVAPGTDYTELNAKSDMTKMVKDHVAAQGGETGPIEVSCGQEDETTYACTAFLSDHMIVLYATCVQDEQCTATGFDNVEKDDGKEEAPQK